MNTLFAITKPGGHVFIQVPINSPATDHLFLLRSPQEAPDLRAQKSTKMFFHTFITSFVTAPSRKI